MKGIFDKSKPFIIAEIASTHEGNPKLLHKIINKTLSTKADAIKLQIFKTDNLIKYRPNQ